MNNIAKFRRERRLTQVELAAMCEVTQGMISTYENGVMPTVPIAIRIAKALEIKVEDLFPVDTLISSAPPRGAMEEYD